MYCSQLMYSYWSSNLLFCFFQYILHSSTSPNSQEILSEFLVHRINMPSKILFRKLNQYFHTNHCTYGSWYVRTPQCSFFPFIFFCSFFFNVFASVYYYNRLYSKLKIKKQKTKFQVWIHPQKKNTNWMSCIQT